MKVNCIDSMRTCFIKNTFLEDILIIIRKNLNHLILLKMGVKKIKL